jgi:ribonuclease P protein component
VSGPLGRRSFGFAKRERVRKRRDYLAIQGRGRKVGGKHFLVLVASGVGRLGITVSKKVGNAVTRNRVKRYVREFARQARDGERSWLPRDRDLVVVARPSAASIRFRDVAADLSQLGGRL